MVEENYDNTFVLSFIDSIRKPGVDVKAILLEAIKYDGPDRLLPIEFIQVVLSELDKQEALSFLSVAKNLGIWKKNEYAKLLFQQSRLQGQIESEDWKQHLIPLINKIWVTAKPGSSLRGWAACWLSERCEVGDGILLSALIETAPNLTRPYHYVRRLKLWNQKQDNVETVLPYAIPGLSDAWSLIGKERLADRAALAALLALSLRSNSPEAAGYLQREVEILSKVLTDKEGRNGLYVALNVLPYQSLNDTTPGLLGYHEDPISCLLKNGKASTVLRCADTFLEMDNHLWRIILKAEATRRAISSSSAIKVLEDATSLFAQTKPEMSWAFHYLKAALHWSRVEYHSALLEIDEARCFVGKTGSHELLYYTHILRQKVAHNLRLVEIKSESDTVLDAIDYLMTLQMIPVMVRDELSISKVLGVDLHGYSDVLHRLRELRRSWEKLSGYHSYSNSIMLSYFSKEIASISKECDRILPSDVEEPLFFAQMRFDQAQLALSARIEWSQNSELYQAKLKPWLNDAFNISENLEAYKQMEVILKVINQYRGDILRQYEVPRPLIHPISSRQYDIEQIRRLLRAVATPVERRWILRAAYAKYTEYIESLDINSLSSKNIMALLNILQDLKQPSLDDNRITQWQNIKDSELVEEATFLDEEAIYDDLDNFPQEIWYSKLTSRLIGEDAICLDFFVTKDHMYCFFIENVQGQLNYRLLSLNIRSKGDLRKNINLWRANMRTVVEELGSNPSVSDLSIASVRLERYLRSRKFILPGPLEETLHSKNAAIVYVAPILGMHGLPLHEVRAESGWCLSDIGPVLQVSKARQLAENIQPISDSIQVLAGPEYNFKKIAWSLAERVGTTVETPQTRRELIEVIRKSKIAVLCGHGWFDTELPMRSRIALDYGMRLTLQDIQELELEGVEIVLLSCWAGWGIRGNLPQGELYSGPTSWIMGGAGAILAPLWPIPIDAGGRFIGDYLEARICNKTRANALQYAREQSDNYVFGLLCRSAYVLFGTNNL